ncbi:hypothetical protein HGRIS_002901 [Hohenbuehelia grisea]|uniref:NmrA-like domain-containing protein n=1 Tax=Hohenbuehelia grisea TaxID=104357 RepID=A0ABR3JML4_9AGAR
MAILITGGTGKTGSRLSQQLHKAGHSVYVASRAGKAPGPEFKGVKFDWTDASTFEAPFAAAAQANEKIDGVYLICPPGRDRTDVLTYMKPFIDLAVKKGVKRFVQLSASPINKGSPPHGLIHEYLDQIGVDYCVLRPTWFMNNFVESHPLLPLKNDDILCSNTENGRVPFVSADDIADAAFHALTDEKIVHRDQLVGGPELLTFDDLAATFTEVLGRKITHKRLSPEENTQHLIKQGLPEQVAKFLAYGEITVANGDEEKRFQVENKFTGRQTLKEFIQANRQVWQK